MNLDHHGDRDVPRDRRPGDLDLAVNVRRTGPPDWLEARLTHALTTLGDYPDQSAARAAVAARHGRRPDEVLLTNGAAEAFSLLARVLTPTHAICVHPSFTLPEAALRDAGHEVHRVILEEPFTLQPSDIPDAADLVILGNPTNPTGVLHAGLEQLVRPGRTLVVDEAFMDAIPGERGSLAARSDLPGLVVVRSITKTWGLAGLRAGYLLAEPELVATLRQRQGPWPVSSLALEALEATASPAAVAWAAAQLVDRQPLATALDAVPGEAPFLLLRSTRREQLAAQGIFVRRCDTFPGLDDTWIRIAVPAPQDQPRVIDALSGIGSTRTEASTVTGHVTLIGAGPGDPGLFTRRAWSALHAADVIVTDRLVDERLLAGLSPDVTVVDAGKAPGAHRMTQEQINETIVSWALKGAQVARLKGGDPFVFGRGAEEAIACAEAGVGVSVIPGLSSAIAAPTLAGIPVTHRGVARSFAVLSGHLPPGHPANPVDWATVASTVDTLVLLMAVGNLRAITDVLLTVRPADTPAAIIEDAATESQRVTTCTLVDLPEVAAHNPAVVIIGPTVGVL